MRKVFIISVNYNSQDSLTELFSSLLKLDTTNISISGLIVDNTGEVAIETLPQGFNLLKTPENRGYAYALNIGLRLARLSEVDYVWILNPDIVVNPSSLKFLIEASAMNPRAVVGSLVYSSVENEKEKKIWGMGGYISPQGEVSMGDSLPEGLSKEGGGKIFECDYVPGCCMFLPAHLLEVVGYLPEEYFLYFEETEWCLRAKKNGIKMIISVASQVDHKIYPGKLEEPYRVYFYNRSRRMFLWRNRGLLKSEDRLLWKSLREIPFLCWSMFRSSMASKKIFLAHFYSNIDFLSLSFFLPNLERAFKLSRERLSSLKGLKS